MFQTLQTIIMTMTVGAKFQDRVGLWTRTAINNKHTLQNRYLRSDRNRWQSRFRFRNKYYWQLSASFQDSTNRRLWFSWLVGYPSALSLLSLRGSRTDLCPRIIPQGRIPQPPFRKRYTVHAFEIDINTQCIPAMPQVLRPGNGNQAYWVPELLLSRVSGTGDAWSEAPWISGSGGFLGVRRYQGGSAGLSRHLLIFEKIINAYFINLGHRTSVWSNEGSKRPTFVFRCRGFLGTLARKQLHSCSFTSGRLASKLLWPRNFPICPNTKIY